MKFSTTETALLISILNNKLQLSNLNHEQEQITFLLSQLKAHEYIKGRLLKFLYTEITILLTQSSEKTEELQILASKIKFKATPR